MKQITFLAFAAALILLATARSEAGCGQTSSTITNLPPITDSGFQVYGLNATGQLTGFFYVAFSHPSHAFVYDSGTLTDLGTFGGDTSVGYAINSAGQVAGQADLTGNAQTHAFLYSGGSPLDLGTLGGSNSTAYAINDAGQVAGASLPASGSSTVAFLYANSNMTSLGTLGGAYSSAFALNNSGVVVGESSLASGDVHGFVFSGATMTDVGTLGGNGSSALALNDAGVVVGQSTVASGDTHGFVYSGGVLADVGTLGGTYASCFAINSAGQVLGLATTAGDMQYHGFVYANATLTDVGTLGGTYSYPNALNNLGQVTGESATAGGTAHAFLWQNSQMIDLNTLLPTNSGWELNNGLLINDAGRIVGIGTLNGLSQWFIMDLSAGNKAPVAVAGPDQTVDCQAQVTLDGSGSSDPNGDSLTFQWSLLGTVLGTNAVLSISLPLGTNVVTLTVTDPCGTSSQANVTVTVLDTTPPTVSCPAPITLTADANCQALMPSVVHQVVALDNCTPSASLAVTQNPAAGTVVGSGQFPIIVTVTDLAGNSTICTTLVSVVDTTAPVIVSNPAPVTVSADANCQATVPDVLPGVVATDNCTPANLLVLSQNPAAGTVVGSGQYTIVVSVKDAAGNATNTKVLLNVVDTTPPAIVSVPGPITLAADAHCQALVPDVLSGVVATDNCTPTNQLVMSQNPASGTVVGSGQYTILVCVKDAAGNAAKTNVALSVVDTTPPTIVSVPGPITLSADAHCQATVPNVLPGVVATDNCTPTNQLVMSQNPAAGTVVGSGNYMIVVCVKDAAGNAAKAKVVLNVVDTTPPTIVSAPGPVTLAADAHCQALVPNLLLNVVASDNCTSANQLVLSQSPAAGTVVGSGPYTIVVSVNDSAGNTATTNVLLNVVDTTAPTILSVPGPITLAADANCQALVPSVLANVVAADNCTPTNQLVLSQDPPAGTVVGTGQYTITVTVTDAAGNPSTASVALTVANSTPPMIQSLTVNPSVLSPPNHALIPVTVSVVATDSCDPAPVSKIISITANGPTLPGDVQITSNLMATLAASKNPSGNTRIYTITVQCTDASNNSSVGTVTVTVPSNNGNSGSGISGGASKTKP